MATMLILGRLTVEQLREYIKLEKGVGPFIAEVFKSIREDPIVLARMSKDLMPWYESYELPILQQVELMYRAFGLTPLLVRAAKAGDPHAALLEWASKDMPDEWVNSDAAADAIFKAFGIAMGVSKNVESLQIFGKYINELLQEGKQGNDKSFFDAIRIDPCVVSCSSFADRLRVAVLKDDRLFFNHLQLALKGKTKKHESQLNHVRVAMRFLIDAEAGGLPDDDLYKLFVDQLKLYSPGEDGAKALRKHLNKQRRSTTQKRQK